MFCLDIYDEESKCYTPHNFLDFCGFECRYNELTERYDVNGLASSTFLIASFDDEEFAVAVTRSLFTLKAIAEVSPQPEARFIDIGMIIEELEKMEDEEDDEENEDVEYVNLCKDCKLWFTAIGVMNFVFGIMVGGALL